MIEVIRNLDKMAGVFSCHHPAHRYFGYDVSPYHIFCIKKCHPAGCVEFQWRCHAFEKGKACPRGFKHVGRDCFSCKQYHETKIDYAPETSLDKKKLTSFIDQYHQYQGWLEDLRAKLIPFSGKIDAVTPHLEMYIEGRRTSVNLDGFYLTFSEANLANYHFADRLYLKIGGNALERLKLSPGDYLECEAFFTESRGRVIMKTPRKIEVTRYGGYATISVSRALVGRATGKILIGSIAKCHGCPFISLVDIEDNRRNNPSIYRRYYCLRGIEDPENCPVRLAGLLEQQQDHESI